MTGPQLGCSFCMLVAVLTFDVQPDKLDEFVGGIVHVARLVRWSTGCLGCRLLTDCENRTLFTFQSEWDSRPFLDRFLASPEFQVLEGTQFLLRDGPSLSIDEVISRGRVPCPVRHFA